MAFPSTVGTRPNTLEAAWGKVRSITAEITTNGQALRAQCVLGPAAGMVVNYAGLLGDKKAQLQTLATLPGLVAYSREQINDPAFDLAGEYNTMLARMDAVVSWITTNFPKDVSGFLLKETFTATGQTQDRKFTAAQVSGLVTVLDALIAAVD